jgi:hypothetical protein
MLAEGRRHSAIRDRDQIAPTMPSDTVSRVRRAQRERGHDELRQDLAYADAAMTEPVASTTISGGTQTGIIGAARVTATQIIINNYPASVAEPAAGGGEIGPCPYPGLAYFEPNDADRFFGRDEAIGKLVTAVGRQSLTALVGASGSGKSSVVLAGLAPYLHRGRGWLFSYFRIGNEPDRDPFLALARALVPFYLTVTDETERLVNINKLAEKLRSGELTLRNVFVSRSAYSNGLPGVLIQGHRA